MKISQIAGAGSAGYRRCCLLLTLAIACAPCLLTQAAQSDLVPEQDVDSPALGILPADGEKKSEAIARYMAGILEEESSGPEKAFESYRRVLDLEPGFSELALYIAREHLRRNDSAEAIGVLKDALKANPKDRNLSLGLASIYLHQLQKTDIALKYAQRALDLYPQEYTPYEAVWEIYMAQNQKTRALQILERGAQSKSTASAFWLQLADLTLRSVAMDDGRLSEEEIAKITPLFENALKYSNDDSAVIVRVADFLASATKQTNKAIALYEGILKNNPDFPDIPENLAFCYTQIGNLDKALEVYLKIVAKNPVRPAVYDKLAGIYIQKEDYLHALYSLRQALVIDPYDAPRYEKAGNLAMYLRKPEDAILIFSNARMHFPAYPEFTHYWANALAQAKQYNEAMRAYEQTIFEASSVKPGLLDAKFYLDYGEAADQAKLYARAEEMLRKSIELDPTSAEASNDLGFMLAERGEKLDEAEMLIRKALLLSPGNGAYLDSLGWVLYKQGKYPEALAELQQAVTHFPIPDPVIYDHIGDTYQKLGKLAEAVLYWQKAAKLDPLNKDLIAKLDGNAKKMAGRPAATPASSTSKTPAGLAPE
ncbi:MAG: tetratricopeptide repeat protein [Chthoniobacterales bacterium]